MGSRVIVRDNGLEALKKRLAAIGKGYTLTVGVHAAEGSAEAVSSDGKSAKITLLEIATINEYGLGNVPERSFIRDWYDENEAANQEALRKIGIQVLKGVYTIDVGLGRLGALFQGQIQQRISAGIPPANAFITIQRKESSTPLIDTGQLRASILWKVTREAA